MTQLTMTEEFGDKKVTYIISKNGKHSGCIDAYIDDNTIIEDLNFTTAAELASALTRAQIAVLSRASDKAVSQSAMATEFAQDFIKNTTEYLRKCAVKIKG